MLKIDALDNLYLTLSWSGVFFLRILVSLLKLTVFSQIFIKVLSNHIFLESHIVTYYVVAVYVA